MNRYGDPQQVFCKVRVLAHEQMFIFISFDSSEGGDFLVRAW